MIWKWFFKKVDFVSLDCDTSELDTDIGLSLQDKNFIGERVPGISDYEWDQMVITNLFRLGFKDFSMIGNVVFFKRTQYFQGIKWCFNRLKKIIGIILRKH